MVNDNTSPEERLFKIIQREKSPSPRGKDGKQKNGPAGWLKKQLEAVLSWKEKLFSAIRNLAKNPKVALAGKAPELELRTVNVVLSAALLLLILFVLYYAAAKYPNVAKMTGAIVKSQGSLQPATREITALQPVNYYIDDAKRRNIFSPRERTAAAAKTVTPDEKKGPAGDLTLQGIVWSDVPKCLMQSGKEGKMYVLKEGQVIGATGIKVKKIMRNKVMLTQGDRDFEL